MDAVPIGSPIAMCLSAVKRNLQIESFGILPALWPASLNSN